MIPAYVVQITTPKNYILNGLWFGEKKPKHVIVWVHGLGSSMFSKLGLYGALVTGDTAILAFNNRGFERVVQIRKASDTRTKRLLAGAAHERFSDAVDDIQGAINFAKRAGVKKIFLAGHSTGCQKSVYWASKNGKGVAGIILLAPVSDYAAELAISGKRTLARAEKVARGLVRRGRPHELMPVSVWGKLEDAQRFLPLYTADSAEEIFSYAQPKKRPQTLEKLRIPTLVLWAEHDEYSDRPAKDAVNWFEKNLRNKHTVTIVPRVQHGFKGGEKVVAKEIAKFMKEA